MSNDGYQWTAISGTAAGTTTLFNRKGILHSVVFSGTAAGTIAFYDSASGTNSSKIIEMGNEVSGVPLEVEINARVRNGLTYVITGTTTGITALYN